MQPETIQLVTQLDIECSVRDRLQTLTGLPFRITTIGSQIPPSSYDDFAIFEFEEEAKLLNFMSACCEAVGTPQCQVTSGMIVLGVSFDGRRVYLSDAAESTSEAKQYLHRLFRMAVQHVQQDRELQNFERDTELVTEHLSTIYEQVHAITQLSKILNLREAFDDVLPLFERVVADSLFVESVFYLELSCDDVQIQSSSACDFFGPQGLKALREDLFGATTDVMFIPQPRGNDLLCTRIASGVPHPWLVAMPGESILGSEEAQFMRTASRLLESYLKNRILLQEKDLMQVAFVKSLISTLDARDHYTQGHSLRVAEVAADLARRLGCTSEEVDAIYTSGLLHDIGKIGISDAVLRKEEQLTQADWEEIKRHPTIGAEILEKVPQFAHILPGVRHHHERIDGKGYPDGKVGSQLQLMPRILAVADAFDAMSSDRPYRAGMPAEKVDRILADGAGTQWDSAIVEVFLKNRDAIRVKWKNALRHTSEK